MNGTRIEALHAREFSTSLWSGGHWEAALMAISRRVCAGANPPVGAVSFMLSFSGVVSIQALIRQITDSENGRIYELEVCFP